MIIDRKLLLVGLVAGTMAACGGTDGQDGTNNAATDCTAADAEVLEGNVEQDTTLGSCTLVAERVAVTNGALLTIEPGSTLFFEQGAGFWVKHDSALNAAGTADEPILFTGTQQQPGFWRNIMYDGAGSVDNVIEHATIEYAGRDGEAALHAEDSAQMTVRNTTIRQSGGAGFLLNQGLDVVPDVTFEDNTVTENMLAGVSGPIAAAAIDSSNDLSGNDTDWIEIDGPGNTADLTQSKTYKNIGIPYMFTETFKVYDESTWTVEPGVEILVDTNKKIVVGGDSIVSMAGTEEAPVTLRGKEAAAGYWGSVHIQESSSPSNLLEHVVIADAGGGGEESAAAIYLESGRDINLRMTFNQVTIRDSGNHGIYGDAGYQGEFTVSGCDTVTFENITGDDFAGDPVCQQ